MPGKVKLKLKKVTFRKRTKKNPKSKYAARVPKLTSIGG